MAVPRRILVVSNRLPVTVHQFGDGVRLTASSGGLATGLAPWHRDGDGLWIGWPGELDALDERQRALAAQQFARRRIVPVALTRAQIEGYYDGFCNEVVWPWLHGLLDRLPLELNGWDQYRAVNEAFADAIVAQAEPDDAIWVHDYHLMLVPQLLRRRLPNTRIGFFLHVPVPPPEIWHTLPWGAELVEGLLGADLIGVHAPSHLRHLLGVVQRTAAGRTVLDEVQVGDRVVRLGVFPMGIDVGRFEALAASPAVLARRDEIRRDAGGKRIVLGVDPLDYTKGIPRRLRAIERALDAAGDGAGFRFIQVAVPSRGAVSSYRRLKRQVDEEVGRINARHAGPDGQPITCIQRGINQTELVALYRAADVMVVTPLRDGMNLVAKEFAASRLDDDGVLVLSRFAGAAESSDGARLVNPYDIRAVASAVQEALATPPEVRADDMRRLRGAFNRQDVHTWAASFVSELAAATAVSAEPERHDQPPPADAWRALAEAPSLHLLLDYDGTLVPHVLQPDAAAPDGELLQLLADLVATPGVTVEVASGRPCGILGEWLGALPITLWAEHGLWRRAPTGEWGRTHASSGTWRAGVRRLMDRYVVAVAGSFVEVKDDSLVWHHRAAQREVARRAADDLILTLGDLLRQQPLDVLDGDGVVEVRGRSTKAIAVTAAIAAGAAAIVAIGDDRTDEDMFRTLGASGIGIVVGGRASRAHYRIGGVPEVRELLRSMVVQRLQRRRDAAATAAGP